MKQTIINIRLDLEDPANNVFHRKSTNVYLQKGRRSLMIRPEFGDTADDWEEVPDPNVNVEEVQAEA